MLALGATIRPQLERALESSDDLEQRGRLKALLARIASAEMRGANQTDMVFDSVHFARCQTLYDDGSGRIFVVACKSSGDEADLVIIRDPDGRLTKIEGKGFAEGWRIGNLWLVQPKGRLLVHTRRTWHDTNESLVDAGASEGLAATLTLLGDGSKVLVNELKLRRCDGGSVFFGGVSDAKPHFVQAPQNCRFGEILLNIASTDGSVWMPSYTPFRPGASRADETGVRQEIPNASFPVLVDEAGNLWTVELRSAARDQLNVCRDGKVIQHLQIPQLTDSGFLISDRPGSVYARTTLGLQHLVAPGPKFEQYRLGKLYPLEGIGGDCFDQLLHPHTYYGYSKHGYLVVLGSSGTGDTSIQKLFLVKLPTKESPE